MAWIIATELIRIFLAYVGGYIILLGLQTSYKWANGKEAKLSFSQKMMVLTIGVAIDIIFRYVF
ncbi:hypothetical protein HPY28_18710 [Brevibacillus sp. HB1.2]|uniref:hypothetical protein n=1 Tax=Brevibacillus TaxID=55080 RepID=UPI0015770BB6|nr:MULTISPECIES: hypothetical protein [Brevibacillus]MBG9942641.1 hypothetical protein [Brevibacillus formosus]MBW5471180.1 hypothetical protein [Brevibacillus formosus]NTU22357.1 hypothetical protein [Brevibacillus sp. HB1.2]